MVPEIEFTDRTLVALMAAIIHTVNEERFCTVGKAVATAKEVLEEVEGYGTRGERNRNRERSLRKTR